MRAALLPSFALAALAACGGSDSFGGATITLTASGLSAAAVSVPSAGQIKFVNNDSASHQIASSNCSELASGPLAHGASFIATLGAGPKSCSFSDGLNPSSTQFQGSVSVAAPGSGGGGGGAGY
jgi:hypothetical protein